VKTRGRRAVLRCSWIIVASWIVVIVSTVVAFAIWLISRVINVDTEITEELGAKVVEIANKRVPRPFRFLFLAPPAGQLGTHPGGSVGHPGAARPAHLRGRK
jgi:hypothetical protein